MSDLSLLPSNSYSKSAGKVWRALSCLIVGGLCLFALTSCGRQRDEGGEQLSTSAELQSLAGLQISSKFAADISVSRDRRRVAVFDGASEGEERKPSPSAYVREVGGGVRRLVAEDVPPLVFPLSWWDGEDLLVAGRECPSVRMELLAETVPLSKVCGQDSTNSVYRIDVDANQWTAIVRDIPSNEDGSVFPYAAAGSRALIGTYPGGRAALTQLDARSGELIDLGNNPLVNAGATEACASPDGTFILVSTGPVSNALVPSTELSVDVYAEGKLMDVPLEGADGEGERSIPQGCTQSGAVVLKAGSNSLQLVSQTSSGVQRRQLPLPKEPAKGEMVAVRGEVVWTGGPDRGFVGSFLSGSGEDWVTVSGPRSGYDPPDEAEPFDNGIVALTGRLTNPTVGVFS